MARAAWACIAAAILTVTGLVTLMAFFVTRSPLLGAINDLDTVVSAVVTVPIALALRPLAARASHALAAAAAAADLVGATLAAVFSSLLVLRLMTFEETLAFVTIGNGLIGVWLAVTAALLLVGGAVPTALATLGVVGGAGLAVTSFGFPIPERQSVVIAVAGLAAVVGLVGFYGGMAARILRGRRAPPAQSGRSTP